ncbi:EpsI family protein [candidate division KSB3 bacterium]|uniref:EpsI family protein n=1 Tax=candidate division KSB3 bacterium TaxID=2044937 RepID=A0A2G6E1C9_9BACT|nr:MAG: EpsI family protein [candidate division KSB3 bacterium]PIE28522.1 MAG: EpsI family protein [candidate division KSB3 bacterium]
MVKQFGKHFLLAVVLLVVTAFFVYRAPRGESVDLRQDLLNFPDTIGARKGEAPRRMGDKVLDVLRVDNYLDRSYQDETGNRISLYVGFFRDQKDGETIHSPRNCMPGSGWNFTETEDVTLEVKGDRPLHINAQRAILVNGKQRMLTYYWYQSRGRFITSEYWHKIYLVLDAIRYNRTDGALVRVLAPLPAEGDISAVEADMREFILEMTPTLQYDFFPPAVGGSKA